MIYPKQLGDYRRTTNVLAPMRIYAHRADTTHWGYYGYISKDHLWSHYNIRNRKAPLGFSMQEKAFTVTILLPSRHISLQDATGLNTGCYWFGFATTSRPARGLRFYFPKGTFQNLPASLPLHVAVYTRETPHKAKRTPSKLPRYTLLSFEIPRSCVPFAEELSYYEFTSAIRQARIR